MEIRGGTKNTKGKHTLIVTKLLSIKQPLFSFTIFSFIGREGDLGETMRRCGFRVRQLHLTAFPYFVRVFHDCRWKTSRI